MVVGDGGGSVGRGGCVGSGVGEADREGSVVAGRFDSDGGVLSATAAGAGVESRDSISSLVNEQDIVTRQLIIRKEVSSFERGMSIVKKRSNHTTGEADNTHRND